MGTIDGLGDIALGGLTARAVEPGAGEAGADGHTQETTCLNCGAALAGPYCHDCGQRGQVHRTIAAFFHDLAHGVFHFEGKVWNTLPMLAWRPGELTRRYVEGQRARFVSPMALFLFSAFLMFAAVSWMGGPANVDTNKVQTGIAADASQSAANVKMLEAQRAEEVAAGRPVVEIDRKLENLRSEAGLLKAMSEGGVLRGGAARISDDVPQWLAEPLGRAARNPELLLYKLQNNAYKYSWALIPISLPFLWLLFPFSRRFRPYDHVVFVTYSLAFMTLLVVAASLLGMAGLGAVAGFAMLIPPVHMFRQLRGAYGLGKWSALWRTVLLTLFAAVAILLFVALLFGVGLFD